LSLALEKVFILLLICS